MSSCPEAYRFKIAAASKSSASKPCTNIPIACILCNAVHWKYNMDTHLRERHPSWELTVPKAKQDDFLAKICISDNEALRLGIPGRGHSTPTGDMSESEDAFRPEKERGTKRGPRASPAGTPRRPRRMRMSEPTPLPPETSHVAAETRSS
ncbi:hypothetical protein B0H10DRAFT_1859255 [Mycena sp. CBHHK59/15]|nr:hypothetical protein B0H10DRAFT_1859255 [Mycena sp. CBHHK59/15]